MDQQKWQMWLYSWIGHCTGCPIGGAKSQLSLRLYCLKIFRYFYGTIFKLWTYKFDIYDNIDLSYWIYDLLGALYLSFPWGCVEWFMVGLFPEPLTVTIQNSRHFYCSILKIWTHKFGRYNNAITGKHCIIGPIGGVISQLPLRVH